MIRTLFLSGISLMLFVSSAIAAPKISTEKLVYEFGQMDNRKVAEHTFVLTNAGDEELHIGQVKPACGCTAAALDKKTLAPGESVDLKVGLSLKGTKGQHRKEIVVESNDPLTPKLTLMMVGEATSPITVSPAQVLFGEVPPALSSKTADTRLLDNNTSVQSPSTVANPLSRHVMITLDDSLPLQITRSEVVTSDHGDEVVSDAKWNAAVESNAQDSNLSENSSVFRVRVDLTPGSSLGHSHATVRLHTNNADFPHIDIPVSAVVASDISFSPQSIVLLESNTAPVTRYVMVTLSQNNEEADFQITKVTPPLPEIQVEVRPMGKRGYRIKLTDLLSTPDMADTKVIIETNLASAKRIEIPVRVVKTSSQSAAR